MITREQYNWGGFDMRWALEPSGGGTRLTLWTNIDRRFISMGAAGWQRLNADYARQFGG